MSFANQPDDRGDCSGLIKPGTNIGGNIAALSEVFNEKATSIFLDRI
jgi:hypothetical protein